MTDRLQGDTEENRPSVPEKVKGLKATETQDRKKRPFFKRLPRDERFDEIKISITPRYKTSGLSGDEWRTSALVEFSRKGHVVHEEIVSTGETAVQLLGYWFVTALGEAWDFPFDEREFCHQPGCSERAISLYKLKDEYCREGHKSNSATFDRYRSFCKRHLRRGDCGLEDADANYEIVFGPGPDDAEGWEADVSESVFGGTLYIDALLK